MRFRLRPALFIGLVFSLFLVLLYNFRNHSLVRAWTSRLLYQDPQTYAYTSAIDLSIETNSSLANPSLSNRTVILVIARRESENVDWIHQDLPWLKTAIYTVDDPNAPLKPPKNKGREAMVYLTFILDNYDSLPDTSIFIHSHASTWHNANLLGWDTSPMIERLSHYRVDREGYVNLRCEWFPGCPHRQHLSNPSNYSEGEGANFEQTWKELHPMDPMPQFLAQPCCAQFAASRQQIRKVPFERWIHYRDWLLNTTLDDWMAGLIFEYSWQYIFTGESSLCVDPHVCYCDGYGVCFGSREKFQEFMEGEERKKKLEDELNKLRDAGGEDADLESRMQAAQDAQRKELEEAKRRGEDFENRKAEMGYT
jgi:hypothetical protein